MALRVGDQAPVSALGELLDDASERDAPRVGVVEGLRGGLGDLPPGRDPNPRPPAPQRRVELVDAISQLVDAHVVVVTDVRSRADQLDPVVLGLGRHRDAVGQLDGPVVERGQDVAVEVDHRLPGRDYSLESMRSISSMYWTR